MKFFFSDEGQGFSSELNVTLKNPFLININITIKINLIMLKILFD